MREPFFTPAAPRPVSPYSQAIITSGRQIWVSGQLPIDPESGALVEGGFVEQARRTFENLRTVVEAAGRTTVQTNLRMSLIEVDAVVALD